MKFSITKLLLHNKNFKRDLYCLLAGIFNNSYFHYVNLTRKNRIESLNMVLDLGCGDGFLIKSISEMFPDKDCIGVDLVQSNINRSNLRLFNDDIRRFVEDFDLSKCSIIRHFDNLSG